jgi:hypothetical protein
MSYTPDRHDIALLAKIATGQRFMKTSSQEMRAHEMSLIGLLNKKSGIYSVSAGGASISLRNKYSLTQAGKDFVLQNAQKSAP